MKASQCELSESLMEEHHPGEEQVSLDLPRAGREALSSWLADAEGTATVGN